VNPKGGRGEVQRARYTGEAHQRWIIDGQAGGYINTLTNLALDIGSDPQRGPYMIQWAFHRRRNQVFDFNAGTGKIQSRDGRFLGVNGPVARNHR
jgi:hypothetical protein